MKTLMLGLIFSFPLTLVAPNSYAAEGSVYHRYEIPKATITYTIEGTQNGTETLYFDNWGSREAKHTTSVANVGDTEVESKTISILDGGWLYTADLNKKSGLKMPNTLNEMLSSLPEGLEQNQVTAKIMEKLGGEQQGTDEILGKTCQVWEAKNMNSTLCIWKGIPLRTHITMGDLYATIEATKVDEESSIPESKFTIPDDVQLYDHAQLKEMLKNMKQQNADG